MVEMVKVFLWRVLNFPKIRKEYNKTKAIRSKLNILTSEATISHILKYNCSVSRFGDGEFQMMGHYVAEGNEYNFGVDTFQNYDAKLAKRLLEVFQSSLNNHLVCMPYAFKHSAVSKLGARMFWEREWNGRIEMLKNLNLDRLFGDTNFTRFYMDRLDIKNYPEYIKHLKKIWQDKDLLIVEGKMSRLGVGNDMFDNTKNIERLLCPPQNAFQLYDTILEKVKRYGENKLILVALGHTATVLTYDLSAAGHQAIDIGHMDIEYEWYKLGAKKKVKVPNKYVNEVMQGRIDKADFDSVYQSQIIDEIQTI
ncbi:SP_1767 family glycosyltransferase [Elizabethkingia meningoseptica]|uniref:SP_1767 family glycosyltransferase n=1 Tax=Elizabethkingia meningoseptica TaxID=238 RepID=UPI0023B0899D|nr:SP_1767 family glycosyltransferase [Elizabethkingia meningoseptica]MDE5438551.1 SP_1767 family glycosyltransferase [Elizabethkingia meningoseptica]MDE5507622.1 SP_1767 family glycosyltransferase [Elizabethkingia meningoseptica]MDE5526773.1 SP_1767 family glycosyltransferase [Elizabethkingia meningoseptica]MDE5530779.1 SP_1767 family glycosyltransferase [Elizabethkingia meningoseptica]MDE5534336.1 SP_1767 family glycosyltransferase [Elizabethkingia meningoseptica]